ncbi:hypothetical protein C8J56DRAFT_1159540 [Mycena floridula]|nr:hypothetical protein C8J56DRAFT_1159540 [Mycena floridula]
MFAMLLGLQSIGMAAAAACNCASVNIPAHVDVLVAKDPMDQFAGLKSDPSSLRRVNETYNIHGVFCQPEDGGTDVVQLLVHGITYSNHYWSPPVEEFQNYSYASFSCDRGFPSLAIDCLGVGLSSRPASSSDVQYPTSAGTISQVARYLRTSSILPGVKPFNKIIGVGHSLGSVLLNFGATVEGSQFPFDGLVLTGYLNGTTAFSPDGILFPARDIDPLRWNQLDTGYLTTDSNRSRFYPDNPNSFSPRMLLLDDLTKDVGTISTWLQLPTGSLPVLHYEGKVVKIAGSEDSFWCSGGRCFDVTALKASESILWPAAKSFDIEILNGSGHDINLDFFALDAFHTFISFVEKFAGLE